MSKWFVLGFTGDDIVGAWQDARLATACAEAWMEAGCPDDFAVLQGAGEGQYMMHWYLSEKSARLLDDHRVEWRGFLIGERAGPPPDARVAFKANG